MPVDTNMFFAWCKTSCEPSAKYEKILQVYHLDKFLNELIESGALDLKNLPIVGYDFLHQYFIQVNQ